MANYNTQYTKRPGEQIQGPQAKRGNDFFGKSDSVTMSVNGELVEVLLDDLRAAANMDDTFSSAPVKIVPVSSTSQPGQVFSPPHTRNGTGYTPVRHQAPSARVPTNPEPLRHAQVIQQQQQQNTTQQLQQMQMQNQQVRAALLQSGKSSSPTYSQVVASKAVAASPVKQGISSTLVAKINKMERSLYNSTTGLPALQSKIQELDARGPGIKCDHTSELLVMQKDIAALKAQNIQVSIDGNVDAVLNEKFENLMDEDRNNKDQIALLTSIVHRQNKQIESLQLSSVATTAMFMANTVQIGGIRQEVNENCRSLVIDFLRHRMNLHPPVQEVLFAQRFGGVQEKTVRGVKYCFPPPIEVSCSPALKAAIWENKAVLRGQSDPEFHWKFYVSVKKPEDIRASEARYKSAVNQVYKNNKENKSSKAEWDIPRIIRGKFVVNGEIVPDPVYPPDVHTLMSLSKTEIEGFSDIQFEVSQDYVLSKSTFRAFCSEVSCYRQVEEAYKKLKYEERYASHIMMGCLFMDRSKEESFSCDDGEANGGVEILNILQSTKSVGFMVFVARWKCGGNMGSRRFGCIKAVTKSALEKYKAKKELMDNARGSSNLVPPTEKEASQTTAADSVSNS